MQISTELTSQYKERIEKTWSEYAKEKVTIEGDYLTNPIYAFGSEIAILRLQNKMQSGRVDYSLNLKSWFYVNK